MQFSSIQPIDRAQTGATILRQSGPGRNGKERVLQIPQSSSITGTSPSDCLVSYPGHSLGGGFSSSAEVQSVYSTISADWARYRVNIKTVLFQMIQFSISTQFRGQNSFILSNSVWHKYAV